MARKNPWFRLYTETVKDRKIRRLDPAHRWLWIVVLTAASESPMPGYLVLSDREHHDANDLADLAALPVKVVETGLIALERVGVIEREPDLGCWWVPKWGERQYKSDKSTERVQQHRERKRNDAVTGDGTPLKRFSNGAGNAPETETETDVTPLPPSLSDGTVDNPSHGHYPFTDVPAVDHTIAALHSSLSSFNPAANGATS